MSHAHLTPILSRRLHRAAPRRLQRGFSLLEALVSIVVLSFGLLGVAGLQASALKYSRDARNQSVAINLAREMAEMIRSNARESGASGSKYVIGDKVSLSNVSAPSADDALGPYTGSTNAAIAQQLAKAQVADWKYRVSQALPGAVVSVCKDASPYSAQGLPRWGCGDASGDTYAIKIGWEREDTKGEVKAATDADSVPFVVMPVTPPGQQ